MGLRYKILMLLAGVLFISMLLMMFVMSDLYQKYVIPNVSQKALLISNLIEACQEVPSGGNHSNGERNEVLSKQKIAALLDKNDCIGVYIVSYRHEELFSYGKDPFLLQRLKHGATQSLEGKGQKTIFHDSPWHHLWDPSDILITSYQIISNSGKARGVSVAFSLEAEMARIRNAQKIAFLYLIINTVLFTCIGFSPLYRFTVKPLKKLTQRAAEYRFGDGLPLSISGSGSEWDSLYRAVNRIVSLNEEDSQKLQETVQTLQRTLRDLETAQREMIHAEKLASVGRLSSGLAHEIGNPIGIIMGYVALLKAGDLKADEVADILRRLDDEVRRVDRIIRQMLDFSKAKRSDDPVAAIHDIIQSLIDMMKMQPLFSGIAIHMDLAAKEDHVAADMDQLRQAFLNIMINAADAIEAEDTGRRGRLSISTENFVEDTPSGSTADMIEVRFADNGTGISQECMGKIFEPFFTTKSVQKGCGLGLWVSMMMVEGFGGRIAVDSRVGVGTTMRIRLPIRR